MCVFMYVSIHIIHACMYIHIGLNVIYGERGREPYIHTCIHVFVDKDAYICRGRYSNGRGSPQQPSAPAGPGGNPGDSENLA